MGCDFFWSATEEDVLRQRKCGWFLESYYNDLREDSEIREYLKCFTYNGFYEGYYVDLSKPKEKPNLTIVQLVGTTIIFDHQFSFVFDNSNYDKPQLVTIETFPNISKVEDLQIKDYFCDIEYNKSTPVIVSYGKGGHERVSTDGAYSFAAHFYFIREQFLPKLEVSDDYSNFETICKSRPPITPKFSESICKPSLAKKWGFG